MRIKVAFVDQDKTYLNRLVTTLNAKMSDKIDACSFSDTGYMYEYLKENKNAVVVVSEDLDIDFGQIPESASFGYLVEMGGVAECKGQRAFCKYQRIEDLYKEILNLFSEKAANDYKMQTQAEGGKVYIFTSPKGGAGVSTVACACAMKKAREGNKVFYLNLDDFGNTLLYFDEEAKYTMSDVLFAVKSKKANVSIKLESFLQQHSSGVEYFSSTVNPYDMFSLNETDIETILNEFLFVKDYDYLVIDINFSMRSVFQKVICEYPSEIFLVNDGSESGNDKIRRSLGALQMLEKDRDCQILGKTRLIYNNMSRRVDCNIVEQPIDTLGAINRFGQATNRQIIDEIMKETIFDSL